MDCCLLDIKTAIYLCLQRVKIINKGLVFKNHCDVKQLVNDYYKKIKNMLKPLEKHKHKHQKRNR